MSAFDPKRTLSSGAVERDPRHNSQPNLLYPFGPCWFFRGCSPNRDNPTTAGGDRVNIPAYAWVLANDNFRSKMCRLFHRCLAGRPMPLAGLHGAMTTLQTRPS